MRITSQDRKEKVRFWVAFKIAQKVWDIIADAHWIKCEETKE